MKRLLLAALLSIPLLAVAAQDPRALLQLVDYVGVDYAGAVAHGKVVSASEYAEMQEFGNRIVSSAQSLPDQPARQDLIRQAQTLKQQIDSKADPAAIRDAAAAIRRGLLGNYAITQVPKKTPNLAHGAQLFAENCAACHGATGHGDGPAAANLDPSPTNFHAAARATQRSPLGLYNTITLGLDGTAMPSFSKLSDADRWALAFYAGSLYAGADQIAAGKNAWKPGTLDAKALTTETPEELAGTLGEHGAALVAYARTHPEAVFTKPDQQDQIASALALLKQSREAYTGGDFDNAERLSVAAYLDGFEPIEPSLRAVDPELVSTIERSMLDYRQAVKKRMDADSVTAKAESAGALLNRARDAMQQGDVSPGVAYSSALIILLREGLEAILVVGAIATFMGRIGRRDALKYLHAGWIIALALGGLTWAVSAYLIPISGGARELTEGLTALFSAIVLFYVGFWMHNKLNAQRWNRFLQSKIQTALNSQALWTLATVSFVAVYREVFETILFYRALDAQTSTVGSGAVYAGAATAALLLIGAVWGMFKLGMRIPLRQFFGISAGVMIALAVIFAGKGVAALQEAGKLPVSPLNLPQIDLLGIYPTVQTLLAQALFVGLTVAVIVYNRWNSGRAHG